MARRPRRLCHRPGCKTLVDVGSGGLCDVHKKARQREIDKRRGSSSQRGYDARWVKARKMYLARHPLCIECLRNGKETLATVVDHITPHRGNYELFWDESNWQSMCKLCHDRKTAKEDGGFGNPISSDNSQG